MLNRFSRYIFKNGVAAKNRVVVPPMASKTADGLGFITEQTLEHYRRLTQSRAGLVFVEYSFVDESGRAEAQQIGVDRDNKIAGLSKLSEIIHRSSALAGLQLVHAGGKTKSNLTARPLQGPSAIVVPVKEWQPEVPVAMTIDEIDHWIESFVLAAGRAYAAGFDIVEVHAAHGYGINQWLSPLTNRRSDDYGGNLQGRSRILLKIVRKIKSQFPERLLSVRLPAQDHLEGGLSVSDMRKVVADLEAAGLDLVNVSSGIGGWRRPDGRNGEGYLVGDASLLKVATQLPIIGVGGISTGDFIDQILADQKIDFAAVGRALLEAPENWGALNLPPSGPTK